MKRIINIFTLLSIVLLTVFICSGLSGCGDLNRSRSIEHYNKGVDLSNDGKYDAAIAEYDQAIAIDSDYANPWVGRGYCYLREKQYSIAITNYTQAIKLDPRESHAYNGRGAAYLYTKQYELALADFNKAIEIDPNFTKAYENRDYAQKMLNSSDTDNTTNITGKINTGTSVEIIQSEISASGGTVTVNQSDSPLNGLRIEVPANSFSSTRTFHVSYAPVESHTLGNNFNLISPLITIDNGGGYSDEIMFVTVTVSIPDDYFAMAFSYNADSGQMDGLPLVSENDDSITIATRNFTNMIVSSIERYRLTDLAESGFRPGFDDWQFPNYGSYLEPGGHCAGQSLTAIWYYFNKFLEGKKQLYGLYDNNGNEKTPVIWQDDTLTYRLASVVQNDIQWNNLAYKYMQSVTGKWSDEEQVNAFAYSILATGQPQLVGVFNANGGHAMIVYKVTKDGLAVADPNYPGSLDRVIKFANGKLGPYNSGANAEAIKAGNGTDYDRITYISNHCLVDWSKIASRWTEMEQKTIGNDKFPEYELLSVDSDGTVHKLQDGFTTDENTITVEATKGLLTGIYQNGSWQPGNSKDPVMDTTCKADLQKGPNKLGIWVCSSIANTNEMTWFDFKWVTVNYTPGALTLDNVSIVNTTIKATWVPSDLAASEGDGSYQWTASVTLDFGGISLPAGAWLILEPGNFSDLKDRFLFSNPTWGFPNIELQSSGPVNQVTFELTAISEWYFQNDRPPLPELILNGLTLVVEPYGRPPIPPEQDLYRDFNVVITTGN
jgi:hypothetical protein